MKLSEAIEILRGAGVPNPVYDARELFERIGGIERSNLFFDDVECLSSNLASAVYRRAKREPLQYIIGEVDFYRETYKVTPDCLIPRQDTEILVDFAVKNIPRGKSFLDLCTGSGCVAISTLKNTEDTRATAIDISEKALSVARQNAMANGVFDRIDFILADALSKAPDTEFFAILSNPPYVSENTYKSLEKEIYYEPKIAFVGGDSGLVFYERILDIYRDRLVKGGFFAFEIGFDQAEALKELSRLHNMSCEIIKDYSQNGRVAIIK